MTTEKHKPKSWIRGNDIMCICDHCGKELKRGQATQMNKKEGEFLYCPECTKELYPKYRKIPFQNMNTNLVKSMKDALARKEYRK